MPRDSELAGGSCPCLLVLHRRETRFHSALQSSQIGHFSLFVSVCLPALAGEFLTTGPPGKPLHLFFFSRQDLGALFFPGRISYVRGVSQVKVHLSLHWDQHMQVSPFTVLWVLPLRPGSKMNPEAANQGIYCTTSK